jgi:hypothetical protein
MKLYIRSSLNKSAYKRNPVIMFKPDVVRNSIDWKEWFGENAPTYNIGKPSYKELGQILTRKDSKGKYIIDGIHAAVIQHGPNGNADYYELVTNNERSYNKILPYINEILNGDEVESSIMVNPSTSTVEAADRTPIVPTIYDFYDEHEDEELEDFYNALDARDEEAYKILSNASKLWLCYIGEELDNTYRICDTLEAYHDMVQCLAIKDGIDVYKVGNHYDIVGLYNGFSEEENTLHMYPLTKENADVLEENLNNLSWDSYEEDEIDYLNSVRGTYWDI